MLQDTFTNTDDLDGPTWFYLRAGKFFIFSSHETVQFTGSRGSEMAAALLFWSEHLPVHI